MEPGERAKRIADLLHEAAETHHVVYRIVDGDDPDWASWYADWLLDHSELPEILGSRPVRSHLVHDLVDLDRKYASEPQGERWEDWYGRLVRYFVTSKSQSADGSWGVTNRREVGPVYQTSIAVICLSVPAHYLPIFQR